MPHPTTPGWNRAGDELSSFLGAADWLGTRLVCGPTQKSEFYIMENVIVIPGHVALPPYGCDSRLNVFLFCFCLFHGGPGAPLPPLHRTQRGHLMQQVSFSFGSIFLNFIFICVFFFLFCFCAALWTVLGFESVSQDCRHCVEEVCLIKHTHLFVPQALASG